MQFFTNSLCIIANVFAAQTDNDAAVEVLFLARLSRCGHDSKFYGKP